MIDPTEALAPPPPEDDPEVLDWAPDAFGGPELHAYTLSSGSQAEPNIRLIVLDPDGPEPEGGAV